MADSGVDCTSWHPALSAARRRWKTTRGCAREAVWAACLHERWHADADSILSCCSLCSPSPPSSPPAALPHSPSTMSNKHATGNQKLEEAQRKVEDVKGVMHKNIGQSSSREQPARSGNSVASLSGRVLPRGMLPSPALRCSPYECMDLLDIRDTHCGCFADVVWLSVAVASCSQR
jgi:hypothetical protein